MKKLARGLFLTVALLLMSLTVAHAGVIITPTGIGYQGRLTDAGGAPVNGARDLTLALYDAPTGGTVLYSETQSAVTVTNGLFSVEVGAGTPVTGTFAGVNFATHNIFLGIAVGADPEMTPRVHFSFAPYSMNSMDSPGLSSNHSTGFTNFGTTGSIALVSTSITAPVGGFIFVTGGGQVYAPTGFSTAMWISTTSGGGVDGNNYGDVSNPGAAAQFFQYERSRVYSVGPGTYSFFLNGTGSVAGAYLWQPTLTAIFIPMALGGVTPEPTAAVAPATQPAAQAR